jgi:hypothetical protein
LQWPQNRPPQRALALVPKRARARAKRAPAQFQFQLQLQVQVQVQVQVQAQRPLLGPELEPVQVQVSESPPSAPSPAKLRLPQRLTQPLADVACRCARGVSPPLAGVFRAELPDWLQVFF